MAFKEVMDLDCDVTTALGGKNRETGKANPTKAEGYFIGSKKVESRKAKSGFAYIHILQTAKGNLGIWGKTDLDRKMQSAPVGTMIRITHTGMQATPNGDMYKYKVEVDADNTIEVNLPQAAVAAVEDDAAETQSYSSAYADDEEEELAVDAEEEALDEVPVARPVARKPASTPDAARQAKVQALLNGSRSKA